MRSLSLLTHSIVLLFLQQLVSIWFLADFFLARDSSTANNLWRNNGPKWRTEYIDQIETKAKIVRGKHCNQDQALETPTFDKIIFIVIDALGSDFIPHLGAGENLNPKYPQTMPFLGSLIQKDEALSFIAKASTPTVTMPRVKALVSGTIPSFTDILFNLASDVRNFHDDNVIQIARAHNKSIVFYGDDTWLSLFNKSTFLRYKETFSFYASDYTTVDSNVTEKVLPEVRQGHLDWDYLIMHYLGLDHIGHVFGSNDGPLIDKKLSEMDDVIKEIYENMEKRDHTSLIIICGDHGMSREGNHGGDSKLESETAMIFVPVNVAINKQANLSGAPDRIYQIDLAVTWALLTRISIPRMSKGVAIKSLFESLWPDTKLVCAGLENTIQLMRLVEGSEADFVNKSETLLQILEEHSVGSSSPKEYANRYFEFARLIQLKLIETLADKSSPILLVASITVVIFLSLVAMRKSCIRLLLPLMTSRERLICILSLLTPILLQASTDYIEYEHVFWHIFSMFTFALFCLIAVQKRPNCSKDVDWLRANLFVVTYLITSLWNQLGNHRNDAHIALTLISLLVMFNFTRQASQIDKSLNVCIHLITSISVFSVKMAEEAHESNPMKFFKPVVLQVFGLICLVVMTAVNIAASFSKEEFESATIVQKLATSWMWFVLMLSRQRNFVFLVSNVVMEASVNALANSLRLSIICRTLIYTQFASHAFFGQGNTNLFSSLDVKPAFYGQDEYNLHLAIPLVAWATFGAQIYWYLKLFQRIQGSKEQDRMFGGALTARQASSCDQQIPENVKQAVKDFVDTRNFLSIGFYMYICVVLRNHLFVWSVISPKLVYHFTSNLVLRLTTLTISTAPNLMERLYSIYPTANFQRKTRLGVRIRTN